MKISISKLGITLAFVYLFLFTASYWSAEACVHDSQIGPGGWCFELPVLLTLPGSWLIGGVLLAIAPDVLKAFNQTHDSGSGIYVLSAMLIAIAIYSLTALIVRYNSKE